MVHGKGVSCHGWQNQSAEYSIHIRGLGEAIARKTLKTIIVRRGSVMVLLDNGRRRRIQWSQMVMTGE